MKPIALLFALLLTSATAFPADPRITSWFTKDSGLYARIYQSSAAEAAGTASTTWSRGAGTQSSPTYSGVHEVSYSDSWVYIKTTGLAGHVMGPWYLDGVSTNFPNFPSNTATIYRFPRVPTVPATKTLTGLGAIGYFVNGVAFFDNRDAFSYSNANGKDADPTAGIGNGDGIWDRDALPNEKLTFDAALAHQAGNQYHYHVQPIALRYQLGDHVDYNATTNRYTENTGAVTAHSPILAWAQDGYPVYGPYGYSSPLDATSGLRRMVSGYVLRDGTHNHNTNLTSTGRQTLPAWAAVAQNRSVTLTSTQYGPNVSTTYTLGHYLEDYDYLGDLGYTQGVDFDLNQYNCRYCVTPEFPGGTYAYFSTLNADFSPAFPYNIGRQFYGSATGGTVTSIAETVTTSFLGGPDTTLKTTAIIRDSGTGAVTVNWTSVDGGTYKVEKSPDLSTWSNLQTGIASGGIATSFTESAASQAGATQRFYRMSLTALAAYDSNGFPSTEGGGTTSVVPGGSAVKGATVTVTITLPTTPPQPPANLVPTSVTLAGSIAGTNISRPAAGTVLATFDTTNAAVGAQNVVVTFNPAPTYTFSGGLTIAASLARAASARAVAW